MLNGCFRPFEPYQRFNNVHHVSRYVDGDPARSNRLRLLPISVYRRNRGTAECSYSSSEGAPLPNMFKLPDPKRCRVSASRVSNSGDEQASLMLGSTDVYFTQVQLTLNIQSELAM